MVGLAREDHTAASILAYRLNDSNDEATTATAGSATPSVSRYPGPAKDGAAAGFR
jgi:hypothetical protein